LLADLHDAEHHRLALLDAVGVGLRGEFVVEEVLERLRLYALQGVGDRGGPLGDAPAQTDLRVDLEAQLLPHRLELGIGCLLLPRLQVLRALDDELAEQEVEQRLSVWLL
jgi:hypothetical protein